MIFRSSTKTLYRTSMRWIQFWFELEITRGPRISAMRVRKSEVKAITILQLLIVCAYLLNACGHSALSPFSPIAWASFFFNPFADVGRTILELDAVDFATREELHCVPIYERYVFQVQNQTPAHTF